jgi:hypothetical protein
MTEWKTIFARLLHIVIKPPPGGRRRTTTTSPRSKSPNMDLRIGRTTTTTTSLVSGLNEEALSD